MITRKKLKKGSLGQASTTGQTKKVPIEKVAGYFAAAKKKKHASASDKSKQGNMGISYSH